MKITHRLLIHEKLVATKRAMFWKPQWREKKDVFLQIFLNIN